MRTKPLVLTIIAACGVLSGAAAPAEEGKDQHFCCTSIDADKAAGDDCTAIGEESINSCNNVLYCPDGWKKKDGDVTCT